MAVSIAKSFSFSTLFRASINKTLAISKTLDDKLEQFVEKLAKLLQADIEQVRPAIHEAMLVFEEDEKSLKQKQKEEEKRIKEEEKEAKKKQKELEKAEKAKLKEEKKLEKSSKASSKSNSSSNTPAKDEELVLEEEIPQFDINDEFWVLKNVTINGNKYKFNPNTEFLLTIEDDTPYLKGMLVQKSHFIAFDDLTDNVLQLATNCGIQI